MIHRRDSSSEPRRGVVLLAALVVIVLLSLAAYQYSDLMLSEYKASVNAHKAAQAQRFADSGIHYAMAILSDPEQIEFIANGNILDNPDAFRDVEVGGDSALRTSGRFSLMAPADPSDVSPNQVRYGMGDEAGKINVNAVMKRDPKGDLLYDMLLKLPNMQDEIAAAVADWLDGDNTPRTNGAENDYYTGEAPPYRAKNGAIESLDELLWVKGITPGILYGDDLNHNGVQDDGEGAGAEGFSRGLSAYLTIYSREQNTDKTGQALVFVNDSDVAALYERLAADITDDLAKFLVMYRQYGPSEGSSSGGGGKSKGGGKGDKGGKGKTKGKGKGKNTPDVIEGRLSDFPLDFQKEASKKIDSFFDLVSAQVSIPGEKKDDPTVIYKSPLADVGLRRELLPKLFENASIFQESEIPARINIMTAPREVIACIKDLTEAEAEAIVSLRPTSSSTDQGNPIYQTPAWLLTEANLKTDTLKKIEKSITTQSKVYRVQALGYYDDKGPTARIEAVIDATYVGRPRLVYWRDLSELGAPRALVNKQ
jgi:type II secretory pathway component PulK